MEIKIIRLFHCAVIVTALWLVLDTMLPQYDNLKTDLLIKRNPLSVRTEKAEANSPKVRLEF